VLAATTDKLTNENEMKEKECPNQLIGLIPKA
jgi:hypothetical protein